MKSYPAPVLALNIKELKKFKTGKVREVYDLGKNLLIVATDRISAFDVILPSGIPFKGAVLTGLSQFWFLRTKGIIANHFLTADLNQFPNELQPFREKLQGRSMIVEKTTPVPVECVVRGYLSGSAWKEYQQSGTICGIQLPAGLKESEKLPEPIFTPTTKAESGHDQPISFDTCCELIGKSTAQQIRDASILLYQYACNYADQRGIIIADTKFEYGTIGVGSGVLVLIDEMLTPDSSRFWPRSQYQPGRSQPSFDKQYVRDYLETLSWDKKPPAPHLPPDVVVRTTDKYLDAYYRLTGQKLVPGF